LKKKKELVFELRGKTRDSEKDRFCVCGWGNMIPGTEKGGNENREGEKSM